MCAQRESTARACESVCKRPKLSKTTSKASEIVFFSLLLALCPVPHQVWRTPPDPVQGGGRRRPTVSNMPERHTGRLKHWNETRSTGFGFIERPGDKDIFVHRNDLEDVDCLDVSETSVDASGNYFSVWIDTLGRILGALQSSRALVLLFWELLIFKVVEPFMCCF